MTRNTKILLAYAVSIMAMSYMAGYLYLRTFYSSNRQISENNIELHTYKNYKSRYVLSALYFVYFPAAMIDRYLTNSGMQLYEHPARPNGYFRISAGSQNQEETRVRGIFPDHSIDDFVGLRDGGKQ